MPKKIVDLEKWKEFLTENTGDTADLDGTSHYDMGFVDGMDMADAWLDAQPTVEVPTWIPVTWRLPEPDETAGGGMKAICDTCIYKDKATPEFVSCPKGFQGMRDTRYYCPNCKKAMRRYEAYCHNCGQAVRYPKEVYDKLKNKWVLEWDGICTDKLRVYDGGKE